MAPATPPIFAHPPVVVSIVAVFLIVDGCKWVDRSSLLTLVLLLRSFLLISKLDLRDSRISSSTRGSSNLVDPELMNHIGSHLGGTHSFDCRAG